MKKLLLILIALPMIGFGQKTYVPDDVFEFYLEGQGLGDSIAFNDSVLTVNIQFLTQLSVCCIGISDMTGIEDFVSLTNLSCFRNTISSIDLSNNVLLTNLVIAENDLTEIDLSNNPLLTHLEVHDNLLDSLDLSNQSSLTFLWIEDNPPLSFLDLRNGATSPMTLRALINPNLYCIDVDNPFLANLVWSNANNSIDSWTSFSTNCSSDLGCMDSTACNYDPIANINDGSCIIGNCVTNITQNTFSTTIQTAIDFSNNGDTIIVSPGTYVEPNTPYSSGGQTSAGPHLNQKSNLLIKSDGNAIIDLDDHYYGFLFNSNSSNNIIDGFTIKNAQPGRTLISTLNGAINNTFQNCVFLTTDGETSVGVIEEAGYKFINCTFTGDPTAENNSGTYGVFSFSSNNNNSIEIINSVICSYNRFIHNSNHTANVNITHSNIYNVNSNIPTGIGVLNVDPLFTDAANGDFSLSNFSPCIGTGLDNSIVPAYDLDGNPRPNPLGSNPDMGAYENALAMPDVLGCMDTSAINYNVNANINDSSLCCYLGGCIDPSAINYDPNACINNVPCNFLVNNITQDTGYAVIQTAIDSSVNGDTIIVSTGTYFENIDFNGKEIVLASEFLLTNDTSYILSTIIDGNANGRVIHAISSWNNSCNNFNTFSCLESDFNLAIIGFTIQNGKSSSNYGYMHGAGVKAYGALIKNNIIKDNLGSNAPSFSGNILGAGAELTNCMVINCDINNNTFEGNGSPQGNHKGAGLYITNCMILNSRIFKNNEFFDVNGDAKAGSAYFGGGIASGSENLIKGCEIFNNHSQLGGAIYGKKETIINCNIHNNQASSGILYFGLGNDTSSIINSIISMDSVRFGSLYLIYASGNSSVLHINNSTLDGRPLGISSSNCTQSIYINDSRTVNFTNSILVGSVYCSQQYGKFHAKNSYFTYGWGQELDSAWCVTGQFVTFTPSISQYIFHPNINAVSNGLISAENIINGDFNSDSLFVNSLLGNYNLSNFSSCVGAGLDTSIVPAYDLDGNPRPNPLGSNPDMGAYESSLATPDILGCMDSTSLTYNINANVNDSSLCCYVGGCIDPAATNYDPLACFNTISCTFLVNNITQDTGYAVIQTAIDASVNGDTIIVSTGTYVENINFNGKNIILASEFLFNNDTSYISSAIIDGNNSGSVVIFENGEDTTAVLSGFTIQNGLIPSWINGGHGGGIRINGATPTLSYLIISNNTAYRGGGIYAGGINSPVTIKNITLKNNTGQHFGGGIEVDSDCTLENALITGNSGGQGGGIHVSNGRNSLMINVTITNNSGSTGGGVFVNSSGSATIKNSIITGNTNGDIQLEVQGPPSTVSVLHSIIEDGENGIINPSNWVINWSSSNIDSDALFVDEPNGDYRLSNFSPCIGAGLDTSIAPADDLDGNPRPNPAGSNPDMGAYENALAIPDVLGCMDSLATNYNASANISDSSCTNCYATADIGADTISGCDSVLISTNTITNGSYSWITSDISTLAIGDTHQGGIVFYLDSLGGGLISAPTDQSTGAEWGCYGTPISGADGSSIGTGAQNTIDIEAGCPTAGTAADICANLTLGGYSDWFLPSKDELNKMYLNLNLSGLGSFEINGNYWSSTEYNAAQAWKQAFAGGSSLDFSKDFSYINVRAVRTINYQPLTTNSLTVSTSGWNYILVTDSLGCTAMDSVYVIVNTSGCTDPIAGNYDINATCDDGSCCYADTSYTNITACDSVVWNGVTYDSSGQYTYMPEFMQIGVDIDGEAAYDESGYSVSLSGDGNTVAIGAWANDGNGANAGHVRVYFRIGNDWSQLGNDFDEPAGSSKFVSLSSDGNILAIGGNPVRMYNWTGTTWNQLGNDIFSGHSTVSLSADGSTVAIGAFLGQGTVSIYNYNGTSWNQLGQNIDGIAANDENGHSVSLSNDGNTIAISAPGHDGNGIQSSGLVRIYKWNGTTWSQLGGSIFPANMIANSNGVSISSDGYTVACSGGYATRVYIWTGTTWNQLGNSNLGGTSAAVSLSSNGRTLAAGGFAPTRIYNWTGNNWSQIGNDIDGEAAGDNSGWSLSISNDGNRLAIGAPNNDGNGISSGHVRIYNSSLTNSGGCDSTAILNLTITNANTSTTTITACDSYTWNGTTYSSSGSYSWLGTNMEACDSTATLNLTITNSSTSDTYVSVCDSDYTWNGVTYTATGDYTYVTINSVGCDSTATLHLAINYSNSGSASITACDSYYWQGTNYTLSGVYTNTLTNVAACDSVATLNLTINNSYPSSSNITDYYICDGQSVTIANNTYINPGTYTDLLTANNGCDSTVVSIVNVSYLSLSTSSNPVTCANWNDGSVEVNASGGIPPYTYNWNTGDNTAQVDQLPMGNYSVTVSDSACTITTSANINLNIAPADSMQPEICYVSVDNTGFNKVVLKPLANPLTAQYIIYSQYSANLYTPLDTLDGNTLTYIDSTSNPAAQAERYKVSAIDACGNGTDTSVYHKTVHLTMSLGVNGEVNLIWNSYEGYQVTDYLIYRGNSASNMNMISSTPGNNTSFTDLAPPTGVLQYQIRAFAQNCESIPNAFMLPDTLESNIIDHNNTGTNTLTVSISSQNPSNTSATDGFTAASASGGVTPYSYFWSNGSTMPFISALGVGTYTVFVYDALGNTATASVTLSASSTSILGCTDPLAINYDPTATVDDGTCSYLSNCTYPSPTGAYVTELIHDRTRINWDNMNDANCMVEQYRIRYRETGTSAWSSKTMSGSGLCVFGLNTTSKKILGLSPSTTYEYYMKAWYCGGDVSGWSAIQNFTTLDLCPNVTNFAVSTPTNTKASFTWDTISAYSFARIKLRPDVTGGVWTTAGGFGVMYPALSKNKNGLTPGQTYRASVRTWCDPTGGTYRSATWTSPIFWTQPTAIRIEGGTAINNLTIYPNPSRDIFNVSFTSVLKQDLRVRVLNLIGEELINNNLEQFIGEYTKQIDLSDNAKGIYFLEIETNDGIINKKIILQ